MSEKNKETVRKEPAAPAVENSGSYIIKLEVAGAFVAVVLVFTLLSLGFYRATSQADTFITGITGFKTAQLLSSIFGYAAFFVPLVISLAVTAIVLRFAVKHFFLNFALLFVLMPFLSDIAFDPLSWQSSGGWLGNKLAAVLLHPYLGTIGSFLLYFLTFSVYIILSFRFPLFHRTHEAVKTVGGKVKNWVGEIPPTVLLEKEVEPPPAAEPVDHREPELPEELPVPVKEDKLKKNTGTEIEIKKAEVVKKAKIAPAAAVTAEGPYQFPPITLLKEAPQQEGMKDKEKQKIKETADIVEQKLAQYKVKLELRGATVGPVVTMYEMALGEGVRVAQVASMEQDLGVAVGGKRVRVVTHIPGKPHIGIEVPNENRQTIYLRSVLESEEFESRRAKGGLVVALGQSVDGKPMATDLARMPHLLVAGTTGSGKSVGVNALLVSLLYFLRPQDVRFILIDPKANEFNIYEGIQHLLMPVVTDAKKAALALKWAVNEMEGRFRLMGQNQVRDIDSYNQKLGEINAQLADPSAHLPRMPYIVVVIDEFADLMTVAGKDVEIAVQRIAQKARAAGIHLVIATQRPTRDVITGTIKSNLPVRIAFRVASSIDSRTILDKNGAELLLGGGDMLFIPPGSSDPTRVHGAFVSTEEIKKAVAFLKEHHPDPVPYAITGSANIEEFIENSDNIADGEGGGEADSAEGSDRDADYAKVIAYLKTQRKISTSLLQRKFSFGYNRAARIMDQLEQDGYVGAGDGAKPRDVLVSEE